MSYDLTLFIPKETVDLNDIIEQLLKADWNDELAMHLLKPINEQLKQDIVKALLAKNSTLAIYPPLSEQSVEKADYIELTDTSSDSGIQIILFPTNITVSFPYWHEGSDAREVLGKVNEYLEILVTIGSCKIYDPQLGKLLPVEKASENVFPIYSSMSSYVQTNFPIQNKRPLWKFWSKH